MAVIESARYERFLDFLLYAISADEDVPFPRDVLDAMRRVVACDAIAYWEWRGEHVVGSALAADDPAFWMRVWPVYPLVRCDDPLAGGPAAGEHDARALPDPAWIGHPLALTDLISERAFRRSGLYAEVCKPLGVRAVMKLFLPTGGKTGCSLVFDTTAARFSAIDREVLRRAVPFLIQLRRSASLRKDAATAAAADSRIEALTPRERTVLGRAAAGETNEEIASVLFIGPSTVRKHLEHIYEKLAVRNRAEATALFSRARRELP